MTHTPIIATCPACGQAKAPAATVCRECYRKAQTTGPKDTGQLREWAGREKGSTVDKSRSDKKVARCAQKFQTRLDAVRLQFGYVADSAQPLQTQHLAASLLIEKLAELQGIAHEMHAAIMDAYLGQ